MRRLLHTGYHIYLIAVLLAILYEPRPANPLYWLFPYGSGMMASIAQTVGNALDTELLRNNNGTVDGTSGFTTTDGITITGTGTLNMSGGTTSLGPDTVDALTEIAAALRTGANGLLSLRCNLTTTDPEPTDDNGQGYGDGCFWVNAATPSVWVLVDGTDDAADWRNILGVLTEADTLQSVLARGRTCTDCDSLADAAKFGGSGTSYVAVFNDPTEGPVCGAYDSSDNPLTWNWPVRDGDPMLVTIGNGSGVQQTCMTFGDDGIMTYTQTESCGVSAGTRSPIAANTGATLTVTVAMSGTMIGNSDADAIEFDLPAVAVGLKYCFIDEAGGIMTIDPNGTEVITFDGTAAAAGEAIVSTAGIGTMACFLANSGGTAWFGWTQFGTFAEATP